MNEKREDTFSFRIPKSLKTAWETTLSRAERSMKYDKIILWMYEQVVEKQNKLFDDGGGTE